MKRRIYRLFAIASLLAVGGHYGLRVRPHSMVESMDVPEEAAELFQNLEESTHACCAPNQVSAQNEAEIVVPLQISAIPESRLREQLLKLSENLQQEALYYLAERPALLDDLTSLRIGSSGKFYYACALGTGHLIPRADPGPQPRVAAAAEVLAAAVLIANPPVRHSRPGSTKVLFLDFNGHVVSGTAWNIESDYGTVNSWDCRPYDTDGNEATFSTSEQADIIEIWERVSEDYAPFDVDVTTEEPTRWTKTTGHALITPDVDKNGVRCPHYGAGGLAYLDTIGESDNIFYSPAWILDYDESWVNPSLVAEAATHELGHNLALSHDGSSSDEYYEGHSGGGAPSWGAIMGAAYSRNMTQWSKGDYYRSNESENDLSLIAKKLTYRSDDAGDNNSSASPLRILDDDSVSQTGVIERTDDPDVYYLTTLDGQITITAEPYRSASGTWGGNLDLELKLYNEAGELLESDNPSSQASASIVRTVAAGKYYLHVIPVGAGMPLSSSSSGYTSYGSLGQYFMSGTVSGDGDGDNIPNFWEEQYFGSAALYGALDDPDNDGADNYSEFIAGTIPNNAASVFSVTSTRASFPTGTPYVLNWSTVEGRVYSVGHTPNLQYVPFSEFSDAIDLPHTANSYTDTVDHAESRGFYRVDVKIAP